MTQIKLRRDTAANFTSKNPVLGVGEPAYETDTKKLKIGDGTTAYTQLEYFTAGGGGSTDITASLPLKIVDDVISLEVDGQTIQIVDGKLHANLDELGNEVNTLAGDVAGVQADLTNKQDKFETQVPLSISSSSVSTSVDPAITETTESWTGGGPGKLVAVNVSGLNIDTNSDWKLHLSGYMGNYSSYNTNSVVVHIYATDNQEIFRIWFGSSQFRLGYSTTGFSQIPAKNSEFFYEIAHQKNDTKFTFNGTGLVSSDPISISTMSQALNQAPYTTLAGKGKLAVLFLVIDSHLFQRIDKDISKSYLEADGVRYPLTSVEGANTLKLGVGDGLSVVDGKLTASSTAPSNMVTTDTAQTITGNKTFGYIDIDDLYGGRIRVGDGQSQIRMAYDGDTSASSATMLADQSQNWSVGRYNKAGLIYSASPLKRVGDGPTFTNYDILDSSNLGSYVDGTTITYTNNKLSATASSSAPPAQNLEQLDLNYVGTAGTYFYSSWSSSVPKHTPISGINDSFFLEIISNNGKGPDNRTLQRLTYNYESSHKGASYFRTGIQGYDSSWTSWVQITPAITS